MDVRLKGKVTRDEVDQVMMGLGNNFGDNFSLSGRIADFYAKFPNKTPAICIDQQCGSGMTAIQHGFMSIKLGYEDIIIATAFEHQTREPMHNNPKISIDTAIANPNNRWYNADFDLACSLSMIQTAQKLYEMRINNFSKQDLDEYAVRSHNLAEKSLKAGFFKDEIVPVLGHAEGDKSQELLDRDLAIRESATLEATQKIKVISKPGWAGGYLHPLHDQETYTQKNGGSSEGVITPGNSSPLNAGAATVMLISKEKMEEKGLTPLAKIVEIGWAGVDPSVMGRGPVPATKFALKKANLQVDDIHYWEINEAFTIVALNAIQELKIKNHDKTVNVRGGSTAIGHPIAATGIRMTGSSSTDFERRRCKIWLLHNVLWWWSRNNNYYRKPGDIK